MAKTKISEYSATAANNTDVESVNIAEGCAPSGINNAIREVMSHLKDFQTGSAGDDLTVGGNFSVTGTVTIPDNAISGDKVEGGTINAITINTLTATNNPTLSAGTANGVTYLNGSKVLTSGSALTFDGSTFTTTAGIEGTKLTTAGNISLYNSVSSQLTHYQQLSSGYTASYIQSALSGASSSLVFAVNSNWTNSNAVEGMRLTSAGLGIGTATIQNSSSGRGNITLGGSSSAIFNLSVASANSGSIYHTGSEMWFHNRANGPALFFTNDTERMRLDSAGNVGINTSSPSTYKDSQGTIFVTGSSPNWATIQSRGDGPSGAGNGVSYGGSYQSNPINGARIFIGASGAAGQQGIITFNTKNLNDNSTQPPERMRIDNAGNVGIGVSPPTGRLQVVGVAGSELIIGYAGASTNYIDANTQIFRNGGKTETMRIDSSGNVGIGTSPVSSRLHISYQTPTDGIRLTSNTTNLHSAIRFQNPNGSVGYIRTLNSSTQFVTSSDYRLKEDWQLITGASERVKALNPVNFAWKVDGLRVDGFLAHEVAEVVPEAVSGEKDAIDADGKPEYQGIDQSKLVPLLTAALQEALAKIESLEARLDAANI